jgi:hypothetical protein
MDLGKSREWTCLVYPDSAPTDWLDTLQQAYLECFISPLHDRDVNPDGTQKKPHYHVVLVWDGPTTFANAKKICDTFGGIIEPRKVGSLRGVCRYLVHLDNPDKAQYDPQDIVELNGASWATVIEIKSDKYDLIAQMQAFCDKYHVYSYRLLSQYARRNEPSWWRCLCDKGSYVMSEYLKSLWWETQSEAIQPSIDDLESYVRQDDA